MERLAGVSPRLKARLAGLLYFDSLEEIVGQFRLGKLAK
jgi:hypothetical protein